MTDSYKTLYRGQLPSSVATLYTVPGATAAIIKHISIVNNDTVDRTFTLYRNGTAAANIFSPGAVTTVKAGGSAEFDGTMALESGGTIAGVASVATQLTIIICGDEVT
jgi:hypothetical protein